LAARQGAMEIEPDAAASPGSNIEIRIVAGRRRA
jgi:hypothetical protein